MADRRNPAEADDDSRRSFDLALAALREQHIRRHAILPRSDHPEEMRWAEEGEVDVRRLDTVKATA